MEAQEHDPIRTFTERCLAEGWFTAEDVAAIEAQVAAEVEEQSPMPRPERWRAWTPSLGI